MLSPSMITKLNGNVRRALIICWATSYWGFSPVPMSPIAAKRTESGLSGKLNWPAWTSGRETLINIRIGNSRFFTLHLLSELGGIISQSVLCPLGILYRFLDGLLHGFLHDSLYCRFENLVVDHFVARMRHDLLDGPFHSPSERTQFMNENCDCLFRFLFLICR